MAGGRAAPKPLGVDPAGFRIGVSVEAARHHIHVPGITGTGKSTWLANLALAEAAAGRGLVVLGLPRRPRRQRPCPPARGCRRAAGGPGPGRTRRAPGVERSGRPVRGRRGRGGPQARGPDGDRHLPQGVRAVVGAAHGRIVRRCLPHPRAAARGHPRRGDTHPHRARLPPADHRPLRRADRIRGILGRIHRSVPGATPAIVWCGDLPPAGGALAPVRGRPVRRPRRHVRPHRNPGRRNPHRAIAERGNR